MTLLFPLLSCNGQSKNERQDPPKKFAVEKTDVQWRKELTPEEYRVLRQKGTERAFTGAYTDHFEKGKYVCAACGNVLFHSDSKFHSACGWPSFDRAIKGSVVYKEDSSLGMARTEVMCAKCGGHLGHVFDDGPIETTGQRFCTNSVSIEFIPEK
jgi:peptide-methionine (R)-S-oxide reductase